MHVAMLLEGTSQEVPGTTQDFHDLGLQKYSHVIASRGDILETTQDFKQKHDERTSQDMFEYVRELDLTSDGSPRYLCGEADSLGFDHMTTLTSTENVSNALVLLPDQQP